MNKMRLFAGSCCLILVLQSGVPVNAMEKLEKVKSSEATEISPQADNLKWYYKTENGIQYKRLWNATTSQWMTDWIKC